MTMKINDVKVATALIIQGFLRANEGESAGPSVAADEKAQLGQCLAAISAEVDDWAENLPEDSPLRADRNMKPHELAGELNALVGVDEAVRLLKADDTTEDEIARAETEADETEAKGLALAVALLNELGAEAAAEMLDRAIATPRDV